jgi:hypothetical protein
VGLPLRADAGSFDARVFGTLHEEIAGTVIEEPAARESTEIDGTKIRFSRKTEGSEEIDFRSRPLAVSSIAFGTFEGRTRGSAWRSSTLTVIDSHFPEKPEDLVALHEFRMVFMPMAWPILFTDSTRVWSMGSWKMSLT